MRSAAFVAFGLASILGFTAPSIATTIHVHADGSGDAPTLAAGLAIANSGDIVLAGPGTYFEHDLQLKPGVTLASELGRDATTIDVQHAGDGVVGANGATLRGFTFVHAGGPNLFTVRCVDTSPTILDNRFDHSSWMDVICVRSTSEIAGNEFIFDPANFGIALLDENSSAINVHDNVFYANDPGGNISAINLEDTQPGGPGPASRVVDNVIYGRVFMETLPRATRTEVARNLVVIQNGFSEAFNIAFNVNAWLHHNTIVGGGGIFAQGVDNDLLLDHNIIAFGNTGIGWFSSGGAIQLDCNDVFGSGTLYANVAPGATDFSLDPMFCNAGGLDFHLMDHSPCVPSAGPCGLVGALPAGCGTTYTRRESWGGLKAIYR
jgi:hypothetical protein